MSKLKVFSVNGCNLPIRYLETQKVKDGVECDLYEFTNDTSKDLAVVRVKRGYSTPLQKIQKGEKTIEGFLEGQAVLTVRPASPGGKARVYTFDSVDDKGKEVSVAVGETMQWTANKGVGLTFYEICTPPYEDGRFLNLPE